MASKKPKAAPADNEKLYDVLSKLDYNFTLYEPGDQVALDAEAAAPLIAQRVVCLPRPAATETKAD